MVFCVQRIDWLVSPSFFCMQAPTVQLAEIGQAVFFKSGSGTQIDLQAGVDGMACLLLAGEPINEPVARYGPFVCNLYLLISLFIISLPLSLFFLFLGFSSAPCL